MSRTKFKSEHLKTILLVGWIIFSALYVAYSEWNNFKLYVMEKSYATGRTQAVTQVIKESEKCEAFPIHVGEAKATLINVDCLGQPTGATNEAEQPIEN